MVVYLLDVMNTMCLVPLMMPLMVHHPHLYQPWQLDRCNPSFMHVYMLCAGRSTGVEQWCSVSKIVMMSMHVHSFWPGYTSPLITCAARAPGMR